MYINEHFLALPESYLFSEIAHKVAAFEAENPQSAIIRLGIGDVTRPIVPTVIKALHAAVDEMAQASTFRGYGPEQGYLFLRQTIVEHDFLSRNITLEPDEIFISDGAKSDTGNIGDLLDSQCVVAVTDPVYPVYIDSNVMAGRAGELHNGMWSRIQYLPCNEANQFIPSLPESRPDVIYLCYPNNPTGTTLTRTQLKKWVDYARENDVLILFDAAYEAFVHDEEVPHSIYEIEGAKEVAIEFRSFSKTAGFTGLRCGYTVIPKTVKGKTREGKRVALNPLWNRRQCTKFNGTAYIIQRAAETIYTPQGQAEIQANIAYYLNNAHTIKQGLENAGYKVFGGENAPYVWMKTPDGMSSWDFFHHLLHTCQVVGTPGVGFGPCGEGYFRLTGFGDAQKTKEAIERIQTLKPSI